MQTLPEGFSFRHDVVYCLLKQRVMKLLYILLSLALPSVLAAQLNCKTITTTEGETTACYHANGKKSTVIFKAKKEQHWYALKIYDNSGKEIYSKEYGHKWGSSGVDLKYYKNGQVESARYTMQPDGGIQHYDVTSYFREDGKFDHDEDRSLNNHGLMELQGPGYKPVLEPEVIKPKPSPNPNECAPVQTPFDFYIINNTSDLITVTCANRTTFGKPVTKTADAGDTIKVESYYAEPGSPSPLKFYKVDLKDKPKAGYRFHIKHMEGGKDKSQYAAISLRRIRK